MKYVIEQINVYRDNKKIYSEYYIPDVDSYSVTVFSHGLGGVCEGSKDLAEHFAQRGIGAFIFDFCGGSNESKSDGKTTEMSVLTEADDLCAVIDYLKEDKRIKNIYLVGKSQGAFVSTIVADRRPDDIKALVGLYPGFVLDDLVKEEVKKYEVLPEEIEVLWLNVGRNYLEDIINNDIYKTMKRVDKDVLLIHGTDDEVVPLDNAIKASETFPNCELIILKGAKHGFHGPERQEVIERTFEFINNHEI